MKQLFKIVAFVGCIIGQAGLAQAGTICPLALAGDFPVTYIAGDIPVITVKLGGKTLHMMVDSGAAISSVTNSAWETLGDPAYQNIDGSYGTGVGGHVQYNTVIIEDVDTGQSLAKDQDFIVTDFNVPGVNGKPLADGELGYDFLDNYDIGLDLPDNRMRFYFLQHCDTAQAPWAGQFDVEALQVNKEEMIDTIPYGIDAATLKGIIDTGARSTLVSQSALDRASVAPEAAPANLTGTGYGVGHLKMPYRIEQFTDVAIGAEQFSDAWVRVGKPRTAEFEDVLIGEDYLSTHRVFVSNSSQTVLLGLYVSKQP